MNNIPWVEKYRPNNFNDLISQQEIINTIINLINNNKLPHMLLHGFSGVGKTTMADIIARTLYGNKYTKYILELNGSDDRGINIIRKRVKNFSSTKQFFNDEIKLVILDEADSMTYEAQFALSNIIENYTHNTKFFLICNYPDKIIKEIRSRCMQFKFNFLDKQLIKKKMFDVAKNEKVKITEKGIDLIIDISKCDMRKCYNLMQSVHIGYNEVNEQNIYECIGIPKYSELEMLFDILMTKSFNEIYNIIYTIKENKGYALIDIIKFMVPIIIKKIKNKDQLIDILHNLSLIEYRLSNDTNENIQLTGLIGLFIKNRI